MVQGTYSCIFDTQLMELSKLYLEIGLLKVSFIHLYHEINSDTNNRRRLFMRRTQES